MIPVAAEAAENSTSIVMAGLPAERRIVGNQVRIIAAVIVESQSAFRRGHCLQITRRCSAGIAVGCNGVVGKLAAVATGIVGDCGDVFASIQRDRANGSGPTGATTNGIRCGDVSTPFDLARRRDQCSRRKSTV